MPPKIHRLQSGKKPLPKSLEDALDSMPKYRSSAGQTPKVDIAEDPLADERSMFSQVMGSEAGIRPRRPSRPATSSSKRDLLSSVAARLSQVEDANEKLRQRLCAERQHREKVEAQNSDLLTLLQECQGHDAGALYLAARDETRALKLQVHEMEAFLAEYGLVWTGTGTAGAQKQKSDAPSKTNRREHTLDVDELIEAIQHLNARVKEGPRFQWKPGDSQQTVWEVPLTIYADGIFLFRGPLRPWSDRVTALFLRDILDGYFPQEFRDEHPNGVRMKVLDRRHECCADAMRLASESHAFEHRFSRGLSNTLDDAVAPMSTRAFLDRLPKKTVTSKGDVIDMREDMREILRSAKAASFASGGHGCRLGADSASAADTPRVSIEQEFPSASISTEEPDTVPRDMAALLPRCDSVGESESYLPREDLASQSTHVRVRLSNMAGSPKVVVVKLLRRQTVQSLYDVVVKYTHGEETSRYDPQKHSFELRSSFPPKAYTELSLTLEEAGLVPAAVVMVRQREQKLTADFGQERAQEPWHD